MADYSELQQKNTKPGVCPRRCFVKLFAFLVIIGVICATIIIWKASTQLKPTPVILTLDGPVQGNVKYSRDGQEYWQFLGIPYAETPEKERKFQPPVPVKPWQKVKQVTSHPPLCAQYDAMITYRIVGEMDCLFLNVFVNVASGNSSKPVLVYIHGGGFLSGGARIYQPDYFMDRGIVLVVMNYRLGPYGFLNLQDTNDHVGKNTPAGNMGLKDQHLVLQWIQKNIEKFGGDPQRVTLFGESAGGVAAHLHVISPMSRGLFHRVVVQSGTAMAPWGVSGKARDVALEYARKTGCPVKNTNDLLECYENTDWEKLVKHQHTLVDPLEKRAFFTPTIDGIFLEERPDGIFKSGNFPKIPIMFGVNSAEGNIRTGRFEAMPELIPKLNENWTGLLPNLMVLEEPLSIDVTNAIRKQYFGNLSFMEDVEAFKRNLTLLISDSGFFYSNHLAAVYHALSGAPTYLYYFNYTSNIYPGLYSVFKATRLDDWLPAEVHTVWSIWVDWMAEHVFGGRGSRPYGVSHGEAVFQLWNLEGWTAYLSGYDEEFSRSLVKTIVDFANDTKPLKFRETTWPVINNDLSSGNEENVLSYMLMDNEDKPKVIPEPFAIRLKFWKDLQEWD